MSKAWYEKEKRSKNELILRPVPQIKTPTPPTDDSNGSCEDTDDDGSQPEPTIKTPILNKPLRSIQSMPYFSFQSASETDIFTIAGNSVGQISMTPEIPSISYSTL